jgi:hypothetical protein
LEPWVNISFGSEHVHCLDILLVCHWNVFIPPLSTSTYPQCIGLPENLPEFAMDFAMKDGVYSNFSLELP